MINSDGKLQSYAHLMVFKKLVAKPRWPPKSPPKSIQTRIFIWPMLCESLKKKAVLVFSVSMGNRLEIDLARIIIIVIGFRKQNRPRGLSVYNNKYRTQTQYRPRWISRSIIIFLLSFTGSVDLLSSTNIQGTQLGVEKVVGYCDSRGGPGRDDALIGVPDLAFRLGPEATLSVPTSQMFPSKCIFYVTI